MISENIDLRKSMAKDIKIENITEYLCDAGPRLCEKCPSQCAYGKRYLKEYVPLFGKKGRKSR